MFASIGVVIRHLFPVGLLPKMMSFLVFYSFSLFLTVFISCWHNLEVLRSAGDRGWVKADAQN